MKTALSDEERNKSSMASFRLYLQSELAHRCSKNSRYSLRSFALHLGIDNSTLSQLLRGKRPISETMIRKLGRKMKLDDSRIEWFISQEYILAAPDTQIDELRQLTIDTAHLLSDACHYSILELVRLGDFQPDSRWFSRVLNISVDEVNLAVARLVRFGLLEMISRRDWVDRSRIEDQSYEGFSRFVMNKLSSQVRRLREAGS